VNGRRLILLALILSTVVCSAVAAQKNGTDISGSWVGQMENGKGGSMSLKFEFKVDGQKLTGKVIVNDGQLEIGLYNGKVRGDDISFKIEGDTPEYTGKITADDEIQIKATMTGEHGTRTRSFTLKRAES
jgi:hypothetical protein